MSNICDIYLNYIFDRYKSNCCKDYGNYTKICYPILCIIFMRWISSSDKVVISSNIVIIRTINVTKCYTSLIGSTITNSSSWIICRVDIDTGLLPNHGVTATSLTVVVFGVDTITTVWGAPHSQCPVPVNTTSA